MSSQASLLGSGRQSHKNCNKENVSCNNMPNEMFPIQPTKIDSMMEVIEEPLL